MDNEIKNAFAKEAIKKENNPYLYYLPSGILAGTGAITGGIIGLTVGGPFGAFVGGTIGGGFGAYGGEKFRMQNERSKAESIKNAENKLDKKDNLD